MENVNAAAPTFLPVIVVIVDPEYGGRRQAWGWVVVVDDSK